MARDAAVLQVAQLLAERDAARAEAAAQAQRGSAADRNALAEAAERATYAEARLAEIEAAVATLDAENSALRAQVAASTAGGEELKRLVDAGFETERVLRDRSDFFEGEFTRVTKELAAKTVGVVVGGIWSGADPTAPRPSWTGSIRWRSSGLRSRACSA